MSPGTRQLEQMAESDPEVRRFLVALAEAWRRGGSEAVREALDLVAERLKLEA